MKVKHYLYNSFIVESGDKKIAIDPGAFFLYYFRMIPLIPKSEWNNITHIFITHGDPDHYWHADRVAYASGAKVICNETMLKQVNGNPLMLGQRSRGLAFTANIKNVNTLSVNQTIQLDAMTVTGLTAEHGPLTLKIGPIKKTVYPGAQERIGWGAIGFKIELNGKTIVNLGDTLLHADEWETVDCPDVLMIPIGGGAVHNTMDECEALQAVEIIQPKLVIPCHYNCPAFFRKKYNPADEIMFKDEVEKLGMACSLMKYGDEIEI